MTQPPNYIFYTTMSIVFYILTITFSLIAWQSDHPIVEIGMAIIFLIFAEAFASKNVDKRIRDWLNDDDS